MKATRKTILELTTAANRIIFDSEFSQKDGFLQSVDARIKLIGSLFLLILISITHSQLKLLFFCFLALSFALFSGIPLTFFLKRFLLIPLFSLIIAIPSIFSFITPGDEIFSLFGLSITSQGINTATTLVLRVSASVGITILLPLTTKWTKLISALRSFYVPYSGILILLIGYRYIFSILKLIENNYFAKVSREIKPSIKSEYLFLGNKTAMFMNRSIQTGENIYLAFQSRGYTEKTSQLFNDKLELNSFDVVWIGILILTTFIIWNPFLY